MMQGWTMGGWGFGHGILGMILMLLFWVLIIVGIVMVVRWLVDQGAQKIPPTDENALEILKKRYARGEIAREEFESMKRDLT